MNYVRLLIAFLLPPLAVSMQFGIGKIFALNVLLTICGFVPGVVHAILVMASRPPGFRKLSTANPLAQAPR